MWPPTPRRPLIPSLPRIPVDPVLLLTLAVVAGLPHQSDLVISFLAVLLIHLAAEVVLELGEVAVRWLRGILSGNER